MCPFVVFSNRRFIKINVCGLDILLTESLLTWDPLFKKLLWNDLLILDECQKDDKFLMDPL